MLTRVQSLVQRLARLCVICSNRMKKLIVFDLDGTLAESKASLDAEKDKWDPDFAKRKKMQTRLKQLIPEFSVRLGGATSKDAQ
ncbi:MAG: hypothetical protein IPJ88_16745 [Myxococcales bacterium]|nr:MAG: hypothetical protein IPJ88_16745 [Myxococcales bacterium]